MIIIRNFNHHLAALSASLSIEGEKKRETMAQQGAFHFGGRFVIIHWPVYRMFNICFEEGAFPF
jgi:hypothetical protein